MSIFTKNKKTIVSGCSWTDRNFFSWQHPEMDTSWKKWDEHVGEYYGWDIINVGKSGASNDFIIDSTLDIMYNVGYTEVERCILALSQWQRFTLPNRGFLHVTIMFLTLQRLRPISVRTSDIRSCNVLSTPRSRSIFTNVLKCKRA